MKRNDIIIELRDVAKIYQMDEVEVTALKKVSLKVRKGEFVSIVGKSGSGKSTLVNQIGCVDTPTRGDVFLDGENIAEMSESELAQIRGRKIGFIFQTFNLMPTLNVFENVALPLVFQGVPNDEINQRIDEVLKLVDLYDRKGHKPGELSGGQRQRVAIGRALANNPEVILADEPTGNLDSKTGKQIMDFLVNLNEEKNVTIIMVTHDEDLAKLAERTITLADGLIINEKKNTEKERKDTIKKMEKEIQMEPKLAEDMIEDYKSMKVRKEVKK